MTFSPTPPSARPTPSPRSRSSPRRPSLGEATRQALLASVLACHAGLTSLRMAHLPSLDDAARTGLRETLLASLPNLRLEL